MAGLHEVDRDARMSRRFLRPLALLALLTPAAAAAQDASCRQFFPGGQSPVLTNPKLSQRTTLLCNDAYASLASGVTHGPIWSAEHQTAASLEAARHVRREDEFHAEERLPLPDQAQLDDYRRSGYDRGHMTPSGDMPDERAQEQTFSLANMVPQTGALNRGIWEGVESAVRHLATREGELYLVSGPAFHGANLRSIGPDGVLVPSSTWKAVYDPRRQATGVYVCKNNQAPTCDVLPVRVLIHAVGIDPFPALPAAMKEQAMSLPPPEDSPYAHGQHNRRHRKPKGLLEQLLDQ